MKIKVFKIEEMPSDSKLEFTPPAIMRNKMEAKTIEYIKSSPVLIDTEFIMRLEQAHSLKDSSPTFFVWLKSNPKWPEHFCGSELEVLLKML